MKYLVTVYFNVLVDVKKHFKLSKLNSNALKIVDKVIVIHTMKLTLLV